MRGFTSASRRAGSAKLRRRRMPSASAADRLKVKRAALAMTRRTMPVRAAMILRGAGNENRTFDPATVGVLYNATSNAPVAVSASGYLTAAASAIVLNQVPQGTSSITRLGRRINMKSIHLSGTIFTSATVQATTLARIALVYLPSMDRTVTTMPPQNVIWTAQNAQALRVINDNTDFKIIRQWFFTMGGDRDAPATGQELHHFNDVVPLNELETVWNQANTNGAFDDMDKGALCLYFHSGAADANPIQLLVNTRLYFHE